MICPLKSEWRRPSACNYTRLDFLAIHGFTATGKVIKWPRSIFDLCDLTESLDCTAGTVDLCKIIDKGIISIAKLDGKREAPRNITECIMFIGETFEPIFVRRSISGKVFILTTRIESKILDIETFGEVMISMKHQMLENVPAITKQLLIVTGR